MIEGLEAWFGDVDRTAGISGGAGMEGRGGRNGMRRCGGRVERGHDRRALCLARILTRGRGRVNEREEQWRSIAETGAAEPGRD